MATKINVKCNFTSVFAQFNTVEDIKELANNICSQVKNAYDDRLKEISASSENVLEPVVEIEAPKAEAKETKAETKKSTAKKGTKTERAKAMAEKFKKQDEKAPKAETKKEAAPKAETKTTKAKSDDTLIAITDLKAIKKLGLTFEKYNAKCYVLRGNTKPLRKELADKFKGVYNSHLSGGEGWVFRTEQAESVAKALGLKFKAA